MSSFETEFFSFLSVDLFINEAISILEEEIPNYQFKKVKDMSNKERFIFGSINNK